METKEKMTDEEIVAQIQAGDSTQMDHLMEKYKSMVRKKAKEMYLLGGENDDLIQEGMIGMIQAVRDFNADANTSFSTFAQLCVSRQMYTAIESSKRKKNIPLNSYVSLYTTGEEKGQEKEPLIDTIEPEVDNDPESLYFDKEFTEAFTEQLQQSLSPLENHVLYLHLLGADYKKIAELLDKTPKTVDNALQRIRRKAEKMLSQYT